MIKANDEYKVLYMEACKNDEQAVDFLMRLARIYRVWDDLYDRNREHTGDEISGCFADAMFGLMDNKFFLAYRDQLWPQVVIAYNAWMDANTWAYDDDTKRKYCANFIKNYCDEIVMLCAFLIGGTKHMRAISLKIRNQFL